ncbi:methyl-accepting chemotaxis protein [Paenibacillus pinistramenti]|uniref:methyl-accepting chemotaxis protein n=1 Tax=Paenibacillus pinistramenti TaxID=1768003 RepID=UPI00110966E0|nr:methyl-accepting chemotaxis protein [Paenibacillus pinistramenti]
MKWFLNLKTSVKLITAFVCMAMISTAIGLIGLNNLRTMNTNMSNLYDNNLMPIAQLSAAQSIYQEIQVNVRDMSIIASTMQENSDYENRIKELETQLLDNVNSYEQTQLTPPEVELLKGFQPAWDTYNESLGKALQLNKANNIDDFIVLLKGELKGRGDALNKVLDDLVTLNTDIAQKTIEQGDQAYASSRNLTIGIVTGAFLISILFGYMIAQVIARPLNRTVRLVGQVAEGDLRETLDIETKDEIGKLAGSINHMIQRLGGTVTSIQGSAESVAAASQQISASTEEIASGSTSQAESAQTMAELFRELTDAINSVAISAEQAAELSSSTMNIAQEGGKVVQTSINSMQLVSDQMSRLENDSNQIGEIIEVIDDIAEQTNLLALNAAIEAARAGDQGRGFAVVADEVRKLAERSGEATKQITSIIKGMQENTRHSVKAVAEGVSFSQKTGEAFGSILQMVDQTASKVTEIAAASEEQAAQSSEVLSSIEVISSTTEEAAASSEETAATAQSLAKLAVELKQAVSIFQTR